MYKAAKMPVVPVVESSAIPYQYCTIPKWNERRKQVCSDAGVKKTAKTKHHLSH